MYIIPIKGSMTTKTKHITTNPIKNPIELSCPELLDMPLDTGTE